MYNLSSSFLFAMSVGKKCSYEGTVRNYFLDSRVANELQARMTPIQNNLKNSGETFVVS